MPSNAELMAALNVFRPWLEEEAQQANASIGTLFNPASITASTLPQLAELKGVSRAFSEAAIAIENRIMERVDDE